MAGTTTARVIRVLLALSLSIGALVALSASASPERVGANDYWILLTSDRDGTARTYSVNPDGSRLTPLLPRGKTFVPLAVSRDGSTVAYRRGEALYASRADGSHLHRVVKSASTWARPALSRDGRQIAFLGNDRGKLAIVGVDGQGLRRVTSGRAGAPDWSPDGKTLIFVKASTHVVVVQAASGRQRLLMHERGADFYAPKWTPDGRWIGYLVEYDADYDNNRDHGSGLYIVDANGAHRHRVYRTVGDSGQFAWSPDSRKLALTISASHGVVDVAVAGLEGAAVRPLRLGLIPARPAALAWSPDGRQLIVAGHTGDDPDQIWIVRSDGSGLHRVTSSGTNTLLGWTRLTPRLSPAPSLPASERVVAANMVATRAPVVGLSADGSRVAFVTGATPTDCHHITVWRPAETSLLRLSPSLPAPCPEYGDGRIYGVKLAGTRVAWVDVLGCGNNCDVALESATLARRLPPPLRLHYGGFEGIGGEPPTFNLNGDGDLLVFNDESRLVRIGVGRERCERGDAQLDTSFCATLRSDEHAAPVDSVSGGLIAIRESAAVAVLDEQGNLVRAFPFQPGEVAAARLDGGHVVVARLAVLEEYDVASGTRVVSRPFPSGYRLTDVDGGIAVLQSEKTIMLLRLADGRSFTLPDHAQLADLEPPGLYYAYPSGKEGRVVFVSRARVLQQLGAGS